MTTTPQWQPPVGPAASQQAVTPWYRKKRIMIPAGLLVLAGLGGAFSDPAETAQPASSAAPPTEESSAPVIDPYAERFGTFATITQSGSGDSVIQLPTEADAALVTATHEGSSNFVLQTLDGSNQMSDLLVNEIGAYTGTVSYGLTGSESGMLQITADGAWTIATS